MLRKNGPGGCCCTCGQKFTLPGDYDKDDTGTVDGSIYYANSSRAIIDDLITSIEEQDLYLAHYCKIHCAVGDEPMFGIQSADGDWKLYLRWTITTDVATQINTYSATLYKIENGGSETSVSGPYTLTVRIGWNVGETTWRDQIISAVCVYDETTDEISFSWYLDRGDGGNPTLPNTSWSEYPSICAGDRLLDGAVLVETRCPLVGVFAAAGAGILIENWYVRHCICTGTADTPMDQKFSKWPAGIVLTLDGVTYDYGDSVINGDHDVGSYMNPGLSDSVCLHVLKREIDSFTDIVGFNLSLWSEYDLVADETTIFLTGFVYTPVGSSQSIWYETDFPGDKDVRQLDDDLDLVSWSAGPQDFSAATVHLTTLHP